MNFVTVWTSFLDLFDLMGEFRKCLKGIWLKVRLLAHRLTQFSIFPMLPLEYTKEIDSRIFTDFISLCPSFLDEFETLCALRFDCQCGGAGAWDRCPPAHAH